MANIEFGVYTKKEPVNLNLRFYHNKIDVNAKTNIFLFEKDFRFKKIAKGKKSSRSVDITNDSIKERTEKLRRIVFDKFIEDFPKGNPINSDWLIKIINEFHERPEGEDDPKYFVAPYFKQYIEEIKANINLATGKPLAPRTITRFAYTLKHINQLEEHLSKKYRIIEIDLKFCNDFVQYHKEVNKYDDSVISKSLKQIKQVIKTARTKGIKINPEIDSDK